MMSPHTPPNTQNTTVFTGWAAIMAAKLKTDKKENKCHMTWLKLPEPATLWLHMQYHSHAMTSMGLTHYCHHCSVVCFVGWISGSDTLPNLKIKDFMSILINWSCKQQVKNYTAYVTCHVHNTCIFGSYTCSIVAEQVGNKKKTWKYWQLWSWEETQGGQWVMWVLEVLLSL